MLSSLTSVLADRRNHRLSYFPRGVHVVHLQLLQFLIVSHDKSLQTQRTLFCKCYELNSCHLAQTIVPYRLLRLLLTESQPEHEKDRWEAEDIPALSYIVRQNV